MRAWCEVAANISPEVLLAEWIDRLRRCVDQDGGVFEGTVLDPPDVGAAAPPDPEEAAGEIMRVRMQASWRMMTQRTCQHTTMKMVLPSWKKMTSSFEHQYVCTAEDEFQF